MGGGGKLTICSDTTPHIQLKGNGPHKLRYHDNGTTSQSKALDLVYRTNPNTLGFERASDETTIWETDVDDLKTTFHEQVLISGTICAGTAIIAGAFASIWRCRLSFNSSSLWKCKCWWKFFN